MDASQEIHFLREKLVEKEQQTIQMREAYARIHAVVEAQAQDAAIWYIKDSVLLRPEPAQVGIRALHAAVENEIYTFLPVQTPRDHSPPPTSNPVVPPPEETI